MKKYSSVLILLFLYGCAAAPVQETTSGGLDINESCVGQVPATMQGLSAASNEQLIAAARGQPRQGGVCAAAVFAAVEAVQVYRVYRSGNPSPYGRWWSLTRPNGSREQYMTANAICPEWGTLDRIISCRLKPGSQIVLGTTQSMSCPESKIDYEMTADIQVYIPNDWQTQSFYVDDCTEEAIWQ